MGMIRFRLLVAFVVFASPHVACAGGFAFSENFIVLAPDQGVADQVLDQAEQFRKDLAVRWLGHELPDGAGRALVSVELSYTTSDGGFWAIDDMARRLHRVRVTMSPHESSTHILAHETTHLILEIAFDGELPIWADEGIAMLQDEPELKLPRRQIIERYAHNGNWPNLLGVLRAERIKGDLESYAIAASLTNYLLTQADASKFFRFALAGRSSGWDNAARKYYGMTIGELQSRWQAWAASAASPMRPQRLALRSDATIVDQRRRTDIHETTTTPLR